MLARAGPSGKKIFGIEQLQKLQFDTGETRSPRALSELLLSSVGGGLSAAIAVLEEVAWEQAGATRFARVAAELQSKGVRAVAWDMDRTLVHAHSHGRMTKVGLAEFARCISPDFLGLAAALHAQGIHQAVATHSDRAEHTDAMPPETHLLGEDLASAVLRASPLEKKVVDSFLLIGYNPGVRAAQGDAEAARPANQAKKRHVRQIAAHFQVAIEAILLLDDLHDNCTNTEGCLVVRVDAAHGFRLFDIEQASIGSARL